MRDHPMGVRRARAATRSDLADLAKRYPIILLMLLSFVTPALAQAEDEPEQAMQAALADRSLLLDASAVDGRLAVVGDRGHILISTDGAASWKQAAVPTRAMLTGVFFYDEKLGWAVGHDSVILRTADGGTTWERVYWAPEDENPFLDVWFSDDENGFAIGAYGSFFVTSDGGATWDFQEIGAVDFQPHLNQMAKADDGRLYIAAEAGMAYRSDDGGASWIELESPYSGSFFGVLPLEGDTLLLFGLRGHLYRSEDAGETWTELETGTIAMLNQGVRLSEGRVVIVGLGGVILVSTDNGRTFTLKQQSSRAGIQAAVATEGDELLLVGEFGVKTVALSELFGG